MTIDLHGVSYAAGDKLIVDGVSLNIDDGQLFGVLGPNGSGKSSLLRLICRLRKVRSGVIRLGNTELGQIPQAGLARRVAYLEQQALTEAQITVLDVVRLGRTPHLGPFSSLGAQDEAIVLEALRRVDMSERAHQFWHSLSGGERQRVHLARALAQTPRELLLDEPTNHLDIRHQLDILRLVTRLKLTCVVALHDLNLAAMFCDRVAILQDGRVVAAGAPEVVLTETLIHDVFGVRACVTRSTAEGRCSIRYLLD